MTGRAFFDAKNGAKSAADFGALSLRPAPLHPFAPGCCAGTRGNQHKDIS